MAIRPQDEPRKLRELLHIFHDIERTREVTRHQIHDIMRLTRMCIEAAGISSRFSSLNVFCDWMVHDVLDRSGRAQSSISSRASFVIAAGS